MESGIETVTFRLTGRRPLLMHNCEPFLNPFNELRREFAPLSRKSSAKKTDADHERLAYLEFMMGMYANENGEPVVPGVNIERMIRDGATADRNGKLIQAAVTVLDNPPVHRPGGAVYRDPDALWKAENGKAHRHMAPVRNQANRVLRCRPIFPKWQITFTATYFPSVVNQSSIVRAVERAGVLVGLGDFRPRFGAFSVEVLDGQ